MIRDYKSAFLSKIAKCEQLLSFSSLSVSFFTAKVTKYKKKKTSYYNYVREII